jgi:hypothetical protein
MEERTMERWEEPAPEAPANDQKSNSTEEF